LQLTAPEPAPDRPCGRSGAGSPGGSRAERCHAERRYLPRRTEPGGTGREPHERSAPSARVWLSSLPARPSAPDTRCRRSSREVRMDGRAEGCLLSGDACSAAPNPEHPEVTRSHAGSEPSPRRAPPSSRRRRRERSATRHRAPAVSFDARHPAPTADDGTGRSLPRDDDALHGDACFKPKPAAPAVKEYAAQPRHRAVKGTRAPRGDQSPRPVLRAIGAEARSGFSQTARALRAGRAR